jgi:hypothetical protein
MNSSGPELARVGPSTGESALALWRFYTENPNGLKLYKESFPLFLCLANTFRNTLALPLHNPQSTTANGGEPSSGEPRPADSRNDRCSTSAETKFKP